jgi:hypothetical protein
MRLRSLGWYAELNTKNSQEMLLCVPSVKLHSFLARFCSMGMNPGYEMTSQVILILNYLACKLFSLLLWLTQILFFFSGYQMAFMPRC